MVIIFNLIAVGICALAFGVAFVLGHVLGMTEDRWLTLIACPVAIVLDLLYRGKRGRWFHPRGGGALFYLPVWFLGILWVVPGTLMLLAPNGFPKAASRSAVSAQSFAWRARITSEADGRREALRMYPSLGVANSALNMEFVLRYQRYQQEKPQFFRDPSWPVTLASECATGLGISQSSR